MAARQETPEQRADRIFKEDEYERQQRELGEDTKELEERQQKRLAVITKYREELDAMIVGKQKGIRFRRFFHQYVINVSTKIFKNVDDEYHWIGKAGRLHWTDHEEQLKAFKKSEFKMIGEIMNEFGCFDY
jgi:hypothetical protein